MLGTVSFILDGERLSGCEPSNDAWPEVDVSES